MFINDRLGGSIIFSSDPPKKSSSGLSPSTSSMTNPCIHDGAAAITFSSPPSAIAPPTHAGAIDHRGEGAIFSGICGDFFSICGDFFGICGDFTGFCRDLDTGIVGGQIIGTFSVLSGLSFEENLNVVSSTGGMGSFGSMVTRLTGLSSGVLMLRSTSAIGLILWPLDFVEKEPLIERFDDKDIESRGLNVCVIRRYWPSLSGVTSEPDKTYLAHRQQHRPVVYC